MTLLDPRLSRLAAFIVPLRQAERDHAPPPRRPRAPDAPADADVPPKGSAWFESSHELMRGLQVVEDPSGWRLVPRPAPGQSL